MFGTRQHEHFEDAVQHVVEQVQMIKYFVRSGNRMLETVRITYTSHILHKASKATASYLV